MKGNAGATRKSQCVCVCVQSLERLLRCKQRFRGLSLFLWAAKGCTRELQWEPIHLHLVVSGFPSADRFDEFLQ